MWSAGGCRFGPTCADAGCGRPVLRRRPGLVRPGADRPRRRSAVSQLRDRFSANCSHTLAATSIHHPAPKLGRPASHVNRRAWVELVASQPESGPASPPVAEGVPDDDGVYLAGSASAGITLRRGHATVNFAVPCRFSDTRADLTGYPSRDHSPVGTRPRWRGHARRDLSKCEKHVPARAGGRGGERVIHIHAWCVILSGGFNQRYGPVRFRVGHKNRRRYGGRPRSGSVGVQ